MTLTLTFDQDRPDPNIWRTITGAGSNASELETYAAGNVACDGQGRLVITARQDGTTPGKPYTSGRIDTRGKLSIPPGCYIEAICDLPTAAGCWPAFWTEGDNGQNWPGCGEIDVVEGTGTTARRALHGVNATGQHVQWGWGQPHASTPITPGPHRYGMHADANGVRFYLDRQLAQTVTATQAASVGMVWPFAAQQHLIVNLAVGGAGGTPGDVWPQTMTVGPITIHPPGVTVETLP